MTCPSSEQLVALITGTADDADVSTHLDGCPTCQRELERLTADADNLGRGLREPVLRPTAAAAVVSVMGRLREAHSTLVRNRPAADDAAPAIPGYEVLGLLGRGGQGAVYKARDLSLRRIVALKILGPAEPDDEPRRARFRREAESLAKLRHPNIVQIYEVGEADGRPYFTMEYVPGGTLAATLTGAPCPPRDAAALVRVLADAVHAAHAAGVVHRDLKPGNILLQDKETGRHGDKETGLLVSLSPCLPVSLSPIITDFGLAKSYDSSFDLTHSGMLLGTPTYMAPEQVQTRADAIGPATDIHALGAILYQMLTGRAPFQGAELMDLLSQVAHAEPLPPRRLLPGLPRDLDTVCLKCLEKDPAKRYPSAAALAEDLRRFLAGESIVARPVGAASRGLRWCRRNPALAGALAALAASLVIGIVVASVLAVRANRLAGQRQTALEQVTAEEHKTRDALERVTAEKQRTSGALDQAREALDATNDEVLENLLTKQRQLGEREKTFLRNMLAQYQRLAAGAGDDSEASRAAKANGLYRAASIRHRLGELDESLAASRDASALYRQLADEFPDRPAYRARLAVALNRRAITLKFAGRPADAVAACRESRDILIPLTADPASSPALRVELSGVHGNLANMYAMSRKLQDAGVEFRAALAIDRKLVETNPGVAEYRWRLAGGEGNYAQLLLMTGRPADAERHLKSALAAFKDLLADPARTPEMRQAAALSYNHLGHVHLYSLRRPAAREAYEEARRLLVALVAEFPSAPDYRNQLAITLTGLSVVLRDLGRTDDAIAATREVLDLRTRLVADHPARREYRDDLAAARNTFGLVLWRLKRPAEAAAMLTDAIAGWAALRAESDDPGYANGLAGAMVNLSQLRFEQNDLAASRKLLEDAVPHHLAALKAAPTDPRSRQYHRNNRETILQVLLAQRDHAAAAAAAEDLARCDVRPAADAAFAAESMSRCAALAEKDEALPTGPRAAAVERYEARAVALFRQARDKGFRDVAALKDEPQYAALRKRPDFQALIKEMEKAAGKD